MPEIGPPEVDSAALWAEPREHELVRTEPRGNEPVRTELRGNGPTLFEKFAPPEASATPGPKI